MSAEQKQQPTFSEVASEVSSTTFSEDPITDCGCPADRNFQPAVVLVPETDHDSWKSRKMRKYHPQVGVKHSWEDDGTIWSALHYLGQKGPSK